MSTVSANSPTKVDPEQIERLKTEISKLKKTLRFQEDQAVGLAQQLREDELNISRMSGEIQNYKIQLLSLDHVQVSLETQKHNLRINLKQREQIITDQVRRRYQTNLSRIQLLLMQQDPDMLSRMSTYLVRMSDALAIQLSEFRADLETLQTTEQRLISNRLTIAEKQQGLSDEVAALESARLSRQQTLVSLKKDISDDQARLKQWQTDRKRLEKLLAQIEQSTEISNLAVNDREFKQLQGHLPWPATGKVIRRFGSTYENEPYDGILIAAKMRSNVQATHHGRVVFSDWLRGYGLVIIIDHGDGFFSLYGHNEVLLREEGDWVSAQETIAQAGSSGGRSDPGLYFAIRHRGKPVNPYRWLERG